MKENYDVAETFQFMRLTYFQPTTVQFAIEKLRLKKNA